MVRLTFNQAMDDHHIFPKGFVAKAKQYRDDFQLQELVDCVANRTLVPKNTNLQIGSKSPSKYFLTMNGKNPELAKALRTHLIDEIILDEKTMSFLKTFCKTEQRQYFHLLIRILDKHPKHLVPTSLAHSLRKYRTKYLYITNIKGSSLMHYS